MTVPSLQEEELRGDGWDGLRLHRLLPEPRRRHQRGTLLPAPPARLRGCGDSVRPSVQFPNSNLPAFASIVAHELGHNLGMNHDDDRPCACPAPACIMNPGTTYDTHARTCSGGGGRVWPELPAGGVTWSGLLPFLQGFAELQQLQRRRL